jgi:hypothetical protein
MGDRMEDHDILVPDHIARAELGNLTAMSFYRRDSHPEADWPKKIKWHGRNYRSRAALENFKSKLLAQALKAR